MTQSLGPVMLDIAGTSLDAEDRKVLADPALGGVILFARNVEEPAQVLALCEQIRRERADILLAIDQEGGRVQRLQTGVTRLPPMAVFGAMHATAPQEAIILAQDTGWLLGMEMAACGLDFSFAPVLDVDDERCPAIGNRAFSSEPDVVASLAGAFVEGLQEAGMSAVGKHYPGHGSVTLDSHIALPEDDRPFEEIRNRDLIPFERLASRLGAIMPAHVRYSRFDKRPAGFSSSWLGLLRETFKFKGAIISDDLSMHGAHIAGGPGERARAAIDAGCDMVLMCNDREAACEALEALEFDHERARRLSRLRYTRARPSLEALEALTRWRRTHARLQALGDS
ncbi:beta-N-acetylhexosaminidase [Phytohalomonas tamaricis]|uniref:beta-N-acetylhexosaminidase n=1 Tax=Phytohalomonas tamaricis TaxID=2081032 RepID=UPI000D0B78B2|nr:beta-N-acetylhexosaminidase [Phytohalomonas tamaricis]